MATSLSAKLYLILFFFLFSGLALADGHAAGAEATDHKPGKQERKYQHLVEKLQLTDEQKAQSEVLFSDYMSGQKAVHEAMKEKRAALKLHKDPGNYNAAEVASLAEQIGNLVEQSTVARMNYHNSFQQLLTDEQRAKLKAMAEEKKDRRDKWKERKREKWQKHREKGERARVEKVEELDAAE